MAKKIGFVDLTRLVAKEFERSEREARRERRESRERREWERER